MTALTGHRAERDNLPRLAVIQEAKILAIESGNRLPGMIPDNHVQANQTLDLDRLVGSRIATPGPRAQQPFRFVFRPDLSLPASLPLAGQQWDDALLGWPKTQSRKPRASANFKYRERITAGMLLRFVTRQYMSRRESWSREKECLRHRESVKVTPI